MVDLLRQAMRGASLAALVFAFGAGAAAPKVPEMQKNLRAIESAILREAVDPLRLQYQEKAKDRPSDVELRVYLAWCTMPSDDAWNQLKAINAIHPENPWVHQGMGRIYTKWKMPDQAAIELGVALKAAGKFYPAMVGLGNLARLAGRHDEAQAKFKEALDIEDDAEAHAGLGLSLAAEGKSAEGKAELEKAIALWPDQPEVLAQLGKLSRDAKDDKGAVPYLTRLADLTPRDRDGHRALADALYGMGEKEAAAKEYERFLRLGGVDMDLLKRVATLYREAKKGESEERALQQLAALEKTVADHPLRMAELAEERGSLEDAEAQMLEAADRAPDRADVQLKLARVRVKRDELRDALDAYRTAQRLGGDDGATAATESKDLAKRFKLPAKPASGSVDRIYGLVSAGLNAFYTDRLKAAPGLGGTLKFRVRIDKAGKVLGVDALEDTVGDPFIAGHVYFALRDAEYPKQKREPVFEFDLKPPKKGK